MLAFYRGDYHRCLELYPQMLETQPELPMMLGPAQVVLVSCQRLGLHEVAESLGAKMITNREQFTPILAAGDRREAELGDFLRGQMRWDADLLRLTLGQCKQTDVIVRASTDVKRFQARYYAAARLITLGRTDEAQEALVACLRERPALSCFEMQLALCDYRRLSGADPELLSENFRRLFTEGDLAQGQRTAFSPCF
jgi:hypothetical protein